MNAHLKAALYTVAFLAALCLLVFFVITFPKVALGCWLLAICLGVYHKAWICTTYYNSTEPWSTIDELRSHRKHLLWHDGDPPIDKPSDFVRWCTYEENLTIFPHNPEIAKFDAMWAYDGFFAATRGETVEDIKDRYHTISSSENQPNEHCRLGSV